MIFPPTSSKKMVVQCGHITHQPAPRQSEADPDPTQEQRQSLSASPPTWSPTAQKSSFRACQVGVVSAGSVREAWGTSSEALGSLPNTQVFTRGKQRPLPEEGAQGQAPGFFLAPHHLFQSSQLARWLGLLPSLPLFPSHILLWTAGQHLIRT